MMTGMFFYSNSRYLNNCSLCRAVRRKPSRRSAGKKAHKKKGRGSIFPGPFQVM